MLTIDFAGLAGLFMQTSALPVFVKRAVAANPALTEQEARIAWFCFVAMQGHALRHAHDSWER